MFLMAEDAYRLIEDIADALMPPAPDFRHPLDPCGKGEAARVRAVFRGHAAEILQAVGHVAMGLDEWDALGLACFYTAAAEGKAGAAPAGVRGRDLLALAPVRDVFNRVGRVMERQGLRVPAPPVPGPPS